MNDILIGQLFVFVVITNFICGGLSGNLAKHKGFDSILWFFVGIFFGILGLIAAAGLPIKRTKGEPM